MPRHKSEPDSVPDVEIASTGEPDVLYGCRFTRSQIDALASGTVPAEVEAFFQRAQRVLDGQLRAGELWPKQGIA